MLCGGARIAGLSSLMVMGEVYSMGTVMAMALVQVMYTVIVQGLLRKTGVIITWAALTAVVTATTFNNLGE